MRLAAVVIGSSLLVFGCLAVHAGDSKYELEISHWAADLEMIARIDDGDLTGTVFSLQDDVGVDGEESLNGLQFLFSLGKRKRHRIFLSYSEGEYDGSNRLTREIQIGDTSYEFDEELSLDLDYSLARLYYGFSFLDKEQFQFGVQGGFYTIFTDGTFTASSSDDEDFDVIAPLPVLGVHFQWTPGDRHILRAVATGVSVSIDDVDGDAFDWEVQYKFFPLEWLGVGAGFRSFDLDVDVTDEGLLDLEQDGAIYSLTFHW